jgi:uncharacterized membrane protein
MSNYEDQYCSAFVTYVSDDAELYILGTTFMRNFYISFDYLDKTMTFTSKWSSLTGTNYLGMSGVTILFVLVGIFILLVYIGVMIFCCIKNKKIQKQEAVQEAEAQAQTYEAVEFQKDISDNVSANDALATGQENRYFNNNGGSP